MYKKIQLLNKISLMGFMLLLVGSMNIQAQNTEGALLADNQVMVRSNGTEPETLDPSVAESVAAHNILFDIFEGLVSADPDGNVVPGLAASWKRVTPTKWQFFLRKGLKWSNGDPLTAKDFVYAVQRFLDPKTASPYSSTYGLFIKNGLDIVDGKLPPSEAGIKALADNIVEIEASGSYEYLLQILVNTQFTALHQETIEKYGKDWIKPGNIVSNGAYMLTDWQVNNKIVIQKNPNYYDADNVIITQVTFLPIEDLNADVKLFESGETDYVYTLPPGAAALLEKKYPNEFVSSPVLGLRYYSLNNQDPLLKDVRVRQALSMVIDRNLLADKVTNDGQIPAYSVIVEGVSGSDVTTYDWASWSMEDRVKYAKQLLKDAGVEEGTTLKMIYNTSDYHKNMAIFVGSEWKTKLGLNTELEVMEFRVLLKRRHDLEYQIARNGWYGDYNDATTFTTLIRCNSSQNDNGNCNQEAENMFLEAEKQSDPAQRKAMITKAVALVMADYPMIPVLQYTAPRLVKSYIGGYSNKHPLDKHMTKYMFIKKQ